ncbi:MAG: cysteine--tRNA ligase [Gallionellales bacterium 35-53-114]|jgi:cysteinyl-tRNA synthetase|nr:MAG: cysteine--tRNA ligase [Gallionellales bacterium 35-53-114]OYZ62248.1 MAG: cysteine--tRNA ligase [Gallionellales bacterium 24-53-125]OZB10631.1 MAG: cysteine--tRNA ligase [Gallionellales bacterium 39-52-133]HQS57266.1 cysteine--tRNA ligase [Gallionellaceae bacterium]HQS74546.1 cysteine--tRNA ligase [Gallionellaceae bacterium]
MLKIYNTLSRDKQEFIPIEPNKVRMYVCGMTVYDYCHAGHARVMVVFDMVYRWLKASGYDVTYVRNITDIDDKIIKRALENNESIHVLTQRFIDAMHEDERALGVLPPDHEPRATEYVPQMLAIIAQLEKNGLAYRADDGDVNYAVRKFEGYGKLSGKSLEDLRAGERVDVADNKNDPLDFVLWKHAKDGEPAEVKWDSPWGAGRPGWHIECSAMSSELLGKHFDIHGGGADLQFPHHENEIAQSEGAVLHDEKCKGRFVNYWIHNGFVRVDNEKMSKSLGNFFTIREVLQKFNAEVFRFFILRAHYRSPLNYSDMHIDDAKTALTRLYTALKSSPPATVQVDWQEQHAQRFKAAMDDDFNTPEAMAALFDLANEVNKKFDMKLARQLRALGGVLGLLQRDAQEFLQGDMSAGGMSEAEIQAQITARNAAKQAKNYAESDRIRKDLLAAGIVLEDSAAGTSWRRA